METTIIRTNSADPAFRELVDELNGDLDNRYGSLQAFYDQFNKLDTIKHVVILQANKQPVGCGAFKIFEHDIVEIKRMYVREEFRGNGFGRLILSELEAWALQHGFSKAVLETGDRQPEAIALYKKLGYNIISNYGQYAGVETSICMLKVL